MRSHRVGLKVQLGHEKTNNKPNQARHISTRETWEYHCWPVAGTVPVVDECLRLSGVMFHLRGAADASVGPALHRADLLFVYIRFQIFLTEVITTDIRTIILRF